MSQQVSNLIRIMGKNQDGFSVVQNPLAINMMLLPAALCYAHEQALSDGSPHCVVPELATPDESLELPITTLLWLHGGTVEHLQHACLSAWQFDVNQLTNATPMLMLDSEHLKHPDQRLVVALDRVAKITYREGDTERRRIYFRFTDGSRAFVESADQQDFESDLERLWDTRGLRWDFSTLRAQTSQHLEQVTAAAEQMVEV